MFADLRPVMKGLFLSFYLLGTGAVFPRGNDLVA